MNQFTALSGALASASAGVNGTTNGDTEIANPNKEVDGGDDAATSVTPATATTAASPLPPLPLINEAFVRSLVLPATYVSVQRNDDLTDATIRRPERDRYVQIRNDIAWTLGPVGMIEVRDEKKFYVVAPQIKSTVPPAHLKECRLYTAIDDRGEVFLWAVPLTGSGTYLASVNKALDMARRDWVKVVWNQAKGAYDSFEPMDEIGDGLWPKNLTSFELVLSFALRDAVITTADHPVIRRLGRLVS